MPFQFHQPSGSCGFLRPSTTTTSSFWRPVAAGVEFLDEPLAVFGVLLVGGALVSGLARRSFLSLTAAFVVAGFLLGEDGLDVLDLDPGSGFVQGLAVIALVLTAAAEARNDFVWWEFVLQDVALGFVTGIAIAFLASRLMPKETGLGHEISSHQKSMYALGVAFAAYGTAVLPPEGNGFISVFVAAIALGIWRPDIRECFEGRAEDIVEVVKLGVFLVFGAIATVDGLFGDGWAAVGGGGPRPARHLGAEGARGGGRLARPPPHPAALAVAGGGASEPAKH